jgi:chromate reductase
LRYGKLAVTEGGDRIMNEKLRVVALVGSLRRDSYTRCVAVALAELAPQRMAIEMASIGSLPLYNEDDETNPPPHGWQAFRDQVRGGDAVLFATPEYNRSIPGVLKNAIDVGSRPAGASVWSGKPAAVLSVSPGLLGGFGANHHLRQCLTFLDMPVLQQPEAYVGRVKSLLDAGGRIASSETVEFLKGFGAAFEEWIRRLRTRESRPFRESVLESRGIQARARAAGASLENGVDETLHVMKANTHPTS